MFIISLMFSFPCLILVFLFPSLDLLYFSSFPFPIPYFFFSFIVLTSFVSSYSLFLLARNYYFTPPPCAGCQLREKEEALIRFGNEDTFESFSLLSFVGLPVQKYII